MNVLFLTLCSFETLNDRNLYTDLMRRFIKGGHEVYTISIHSDSAGKDGVAADDRAHILHLYRDNSRSQTNLIKKGMNYLSFGRSIPRALKRYFSDVVFDLVVYATPPLTFYAAVRYIKKRDHAFTYLMLKDIFPQNAVDMGMLRTTGVKGRVRRYFDSIEKKLYAISDAIGCMSRANVDYLLSHNPSIPQKKVGVCPNSIEVMPVSVSPDEKDAIRRRYGLPIDKKVFVYGGNLGKPQDIPFIIRCLQREQDDPDVCYLIVGSGTEYPLMKRFFDEEKPKNAVLLEQLPREEYDRMIAACDVGLIFLHHDFTIPNFPSRLLAYMQAGLPVLACTDTATDIGKVIESGGFGCWCESDSPEHFHEGAQRIKALLADDRCASRAREYLTEHFTDEITYNIITDTMKSCL